MLLAGCDNGGSSSSATSSEAKSSTPSSSEVVPGSSSEEETSSEELSSEEESSEELSSEEESSSGSEAASSETASSEEESSEASSEEQSSEQSSEESSSEPEPDPVPQDVLNDAKVFFDNLPTTRRSIHGVVTNLNGDPYQYPGSTFSYNAETNTGYSNGQYPMVVKPRAGIPNVCEIYYSYDDGVTCTDESVRTASMAYEWTVNSQPTIIYEIARSFTASPSATAKKLPSITATLTRDDRYGVDVFTNINITKSTGELTKQNGHNTLVLDFEMTYTRRKKTGDYNTSGYSWDDKSLVAQILIEAEDEFVYEIKYTGVVNGDNENRAELSAKYYQGADDAATNEFIGSFPAYSGEESSIYFDTPDISFNYNGVDDAFSYYSDAVKVGEYFNVAFLQDYFATSFSYKNFDVTGIYLDPEHTQPFISVDYANEPYTFYITGAPKEGYHVVTTLLEKKSIYSQFGQSYLYSVPEFTKEEKALIIAENGVKKESSCSVVSHGTKWEDLYWDTTYDIYNGDTRVYINGELTRENSTTINADTTIKKTYTYTDYRFNQESSENRDVLNAYDIRDVAIYEDEHGFVLNAYYTYSNYKYWFKIPRSVIEEKNLTFTCAGYKRDGVILEGDDVDLTGAESYDYYSFSYGYFDGGSFVKGVTDPTTITEGDVFLCIATDYYYKKDTNGKIHYVSVK